MRYIIFLIYILFFSAKTLEAYSTIYSGGGQTNYIQDKGIIYFSGKFKNENSTMLLIGNAGLVLENDLDNYGSIEGNETDNGWISFASIYQNQEINPEIDSNAYFSVGELRFESQTSNPSIISIKNMTINNDAYFSYGVVSSSKDNLETALNIEPNASLIIPEESYTDNNLISGIVVLKEVSEKVKIPLGDLKDDGSHYSGFLQIEPVEDNPQNPLSFEIQYVAEKTTKPRNNLQAALGTIGLVSEVEYWRIVPIFEQGKNTSSIYTDYKFSVSWDRSRFYADNSLSQLEPEKYRLLRWDNELENYEILDDSFIDYSSNMLGGIIYGISEEEELLIGEDLLGLLEDDEGFQVLTVNDDGLNDYLIINIDEDCYISNLFVVDEKGNLVYEHEGYYENQWYGQMSDNYIESATFLGGDFTKNTVPSGTYYYKFTTVCEDGSSNEYVKWVQILNKY